MTIVTWQLILKWFVSFGALYAFYMAFLQRMTFFRQRRIYLLLGSILALVIPFVSLQSILVSDGQQTVVQYIQKMPALPDSPIPQENIHTNTMSLANLFSYFVLLVSFMFAIRFVLILFSYKSVTRNAQLLETYDAFQLYQLENDGPALSFGNKIFIGNGNMTTEEKDKIVQHELAHVKQRHSWDTIWMELLTIVNWFNPFVWLLKREVRDNLEYLADKTVLENDTNKKDYQYLLLNTLLYNNNQNKISFTNNFNISSLKKRIAMMNKNQTSKINRWRILLILPILGIVLFSFRKKDNSKDSIQIAGIVLDAVTKKPIEGVKVILKFDSLTFFSRTNLNGYYNLNIKMSDFSNKTGEAQNILIFHNGYKPLNSGFTSTSQNSSNTIANFQLSPDTSEIGSSSSFQKATQVDYNFIKKKMDHDLNEEKITTEIKKSNKVAIIKDGTIYFINSRGSLTLTPDNMRYTLENITINGTKSVTIDELNKNYKPDDFLASTKDGKINLETKNK
ncbi:MAG: hypothetical protein DI598_12035 [Pseudopedobacter saltans]|uniref:Peptidase M56 domain-containing protein n=1 Tax=Pseudopedobacter saltans TaxID=151895 RepID=A0A2W5EY50_9SPHI|nr:MAG: hypothetical protein DI598_12035 [Pseudopedobacter saltans]